MTQISTPAAAAAFLEELAADGMTAPEYGWTRSTADNWTAAARSLAAITDHRLTGLPALVDYWPPPARAILPNGYPPLVTPTPNIDAGPRRWYASPGESDTSDYLPALEYLGPAAVRNVALAVLANATRAELAHAAGLQAYPRRVAAALREESTAYARLAQLATGPALELTRCLAALLEPTPAPPPTYQRRLAELAPAIPLTLTP